MAKWPHLMYAGRETQKGSSIMANEYWTVVWMSKRKYATTPHDEDHPDGPARYNEERDFDSEAEAVAFAKSVQSDVISDEIYVDHHRFRHGQWDCEEIEVG